MGLYGSSVGSFDVSTTVAQITGDWPSVSNGKCSFSAGGLVGSCNVLDAVELGGVWFFAILGSALFRLGAVFYLMYQIFSVLNGFSNFPFFGWFFGICLLVLAVETFTLLRSGHHSGMSQA